MIVGPSCHGAPHPFRSILFATDLDTTGLRSAQFASSFAERFHGQLTLLHVIEKKSRRFAVQPELAEDAVRAELSSLLPPDIEVYTNATIRVEHGKAGEIIPQVARTVCASLIVTGAGNHTSLGDHCPWSTLSEVIRESPCPVLTVQSHLR
jgi:nucleotide-binding universal stress UspA family protein